MLVSSDLLLYYQRCDRRAYLDVLGDPRAKKPTDDFLMKLRQDSHAHRQEELSQYDYDRPDWRGDDWYGADRATRELMERGVDCIYRGVLTTTWRPGGANGAAVTLLSKPDLLVREPGRSEFGNWHYVAKDIRFGKRPKLDYQIVGAFHGLVLSLVQGTWPPTTWLVLRGRSPHPVDFAKRVPEMSRLLDRCIATLRQSQTPELFLSRQKCNLCHWYAYCRAEALAERHLSLVPGVTPSRYEQLQLMGVETLSALAQMSSAQLQAAFGKETGKQLSQQAIASASDRALPKPEAIARLLRQSPSDWLDRNGSPIEIHFDIEAEPDLDLDFLLGALVVDRRSGQQTYHSFLAESPADEGRVWSEFLELMDAYPQAPIYHFCDYEVKTIRRLARLYRTAPSRTEALVRRCVDLHQWVTQATVLPVESYALKPIARWLGFDWRNPNANGAQCICWYNDWLDTGDRAALAAIVEYNEDDCRATHALKTWLAEFLQPADLAAMPQPSVAPPA